MRIIRAHIFGFGKWVDKVFEFPKHDLVVFFGENESGKSTFHQFLLFMLFGMRPKQRKFYQPKTSGKLGGRLFLEDAAAGRFTIERFDDQYNGEARCITEEGKIYDEVWLQERLHGMDEHTFAAIFSFSALDLNAIENMSEEELSDVLLSIGLTGSNRIHQIEKQLDKRLGELFKPYGKNPEINKQLQTVQRLADELAAIRKEEATYFAKTTEAETLEDRLHNLQETQVALEKRSNELAKKAGALPIIEKYQHLLEKRRSFQEIYEFPANGLERLENVKETLRPLESEYNVLENNLANYRNSLETLEKDRLSQEISAELEIKLTKKSVYEKLLENRQQLEKHLEELDWQIGKELAELEIDLNEEQLGDLSLPFYIEETWKNLREQKDRLVAEKISLDTEKSAIMETEKYLEGQLAEKRNALLDEREIAKLQQTLDEQRELKERKRIREAALKQQKRFQENKKEKLNRAKRLVGLGVIFSFASFLGGFILNESALYGLGVLLLLFGTGIYAMTMQNTKEMEKLFEAPMDQHEIFMLSEDEIEDIQQILHKEAEKKEHVQSLEKDLQTQRIRLLQWEEKAHVFTEKEKRYIELMEQQYELFPFLRSIDPIYWPDYYRRMKELITLHEKKANLNETLQELGRKLSNLEDELFSFVDTLKAGAVSSIEEAFSIMEEIFESEFRREQRKTHLQELIEAAEQKQLSLVEEINVHQRDKDELFQMAGARTEEEFHEIARYNAEKKRLEDELKMTERQLSALFPEKEWKAFAQERPDAFELENSQKETEKEQREISRQMEETREKLADVYAELKRMEGSEVYSEKLHQLEMEKEKLNRLAKEWAIVKLEKGVLAETKLRYQEKYLPKVMETTTAYFRTMTGGRYTAVYLPEDEETFQVMMEDGLLYSVGELSQGATNQLYVALRLAISTVMTEKSRLPFILDDAFVHFDEKRTKWTMELLRKIAQVRQVIVFTCKSDVRKACDDLEIAVQMLQRGEWHREHPTKGQIREEELEWKH